jgi:hypothetical protein
MPSQKYKYLVDKETGDIRLRSSGSLQPRDPEKEVLIGSDKKMLPGEHVYDFDMESFGKIPDEVLIRRRRKLREQADNFGDSYPEFVGAFKSLPPELRTVLLIMLEHPEPEMLSIAKKVDAELRAKEGRKKKGAVKKTTTKRKKAGAKAPTKSS